MSVWTTCTTKVSDSRPHPFQIKIHSLTPPRTGEGHFDDGSNKPSGAATPISPPDAAAATKAGKKGKGISKKAKTAKQRLAIADATGDMGMGG